MNVLIDSRGWIEYFSGGPLASKYAKFVESANTFEFLAPSIVLYEVYKKIKSEKDEETAIKAVAYIVGNARIISIGKKIALNAADISIISKLPMADAMIKAVAEDNNAKLVTGDKHFKDLENVIFVE